VHHATHIVQPTRRVRHATRTIDRRAGMMQNS
jgi:hypothetical protein